MSGWLRRAFPMRFADLRVRPKLMVLHNIFFLVLTCAVYLSIIPLLENRIERAEAREVRLITQLFSQEAERTLEGASPLAHPVLEIYEFQEGTASELGLPSEARHWLIANPDSVWHSPGRSGLIYRRDQRTAVYQKVRLPYAFYDGAIFRARIALFVVLGVIYVLAVLLLEFYIMPKHVYQPIHRVLDADRAARTGDREREIVQDQHIPGDEIGQIMRSRNETVAELRRHEEELARALEQLEAQDRLASLGLLSASVAHEMNTPLAVLHGSIEKLLETSGNAPTKERLGRMLRVTERLRTISETLLDFARVRKQSTELVGVRPLIDEAWSLVAIDEKASNVTFENATGEHSVTANPDRLVQVFVNLLSNALNAVPPGGHIVVHSGCATGEHGRTSVWIAVEDDGPGIAPDVLPGIFDAFVSTRLDARGTGLGLTVAEGIVRQHDGTILASNRPEGGARLEVRLPAARTAVAKR